MFKLFYESEESVIISFLLIICKTFCKVFYCAKPVRYHGYYVSHLLLADQMEDLNFRQINKKPSQYVNEYVNHGVWEQPLYCEYYAEHY